MAAEGLDALVITSSAVGQGFTSRLEPGMMVSVEPMLGNANGYYYLEHQYLVTETGRECLHEPAPEQLPIVPPDAGVG